MFIQVGLYKYWPEDAIGSHKPAENHQLLYSSEREREREMKIVQEEYRKGPWTEQEDILLVNFVHLFGDRRWDFVAKVSGLKVEGET